LSWAAANHVATRHVLLDAILVEEGEHLALPYRVGHWIATHSLRQPDIPQAIAVGVVQIEDGILRRRSDAAHQSTDLHMHAAVRILD